MHLQICLYTYVDILLQAPYTTYTMVPTHEGAYMVGTREGHVVILLGPILLQPNQLHRHVKPWPKSSWLSNIPSTESMSRQAQHFERLFSKLCLCLPTPRDEATSHQSIESYQRRPQTDCKDTMTHYAGQANNKCAPS